MPNPIEPVASVTDDGFKASDSCVASVDALGEFRFDRVRGGAGCAAKRVDQ
jgi:hypothetical protein